MQPPTEFMQMDTRYRNNLGRSLKASEILNGESTNEASG